MINFQDHILKLHVSNPLIGHKTYEFSSKDSVSDLRNTVCETTELMMYENFHFECENKVVSEFLQMGDTLTFGAKINVVFNPFDQRSSKYHYSKTKSLLENPGIAVNHCGGFDQMNAKKQSSSGLKLCESIDRFIQSLEKQELLEVKYPEPEYNFSQWINFSGYNPVPYYRKLMGDFYYIYFKSPQEIDYHITGHAQGFFLNQSTNAHFNPAISTKNSKMYISLLDLLYAVSPKFQELFKACLNKLRTSQNQKTLIGPLLNKKSQWLKDRKQATSTNTWKINPLQRSLRKQQLLTIKDWNEMFQIQHLQPSSNLYDKINRQKLKFKIYQQFVDHSKLGAINVVEKMIMPINPNCPKNQQTFMFTNLYFSYVDNAMEEKDLVELLKANGADYAKLNKKKAKAVNNQILQLETVDNIEGLDFHLSHTVLVQYKGQKLRAQSFPSALIHSKSKDQPIQQIIDRKNYINNHVHLTQISLNSSLQFNKEFSQAMMKLTFKLNLEHDMVIKLLRDEMMLAKKIIVSTELRGIQISERRKYLFNLYSLLPKDYNFTQSQQTQKYQKQNTTKQNPTTSTTTIPQPHHQQDFDNFVLRPQLIALYNQKFKCRLPVNCMLGKTLHQNYQVVMNQKLRTQEKKLKAMAGFAKDHVIAMVINAFQGDMKKYVADTKNIIDVMHKYGLNVRYLGFLYKKIDKKRSPHLQIAIQKVIYLKCLKNILNTGLKSVSPANCKFLVSHFLNCIFYPTKVMSEEYVAYKGTKEEEAQQQQQSNDGVKRRKKRNKEKEREDSLLTLHTQDNGEFFLSLKPSQLSILIRKLAKLKYNHQFQSLPQQLLQPKLFTYKYGRLSLLREICLHTGILLQKRQYFSQKFSSSTQPFSPQQVYGFQARCSHTMLDKKELDQLINQGDNLLAQFFVQESIEAYNKAIQYILTTFGGNNEKLPLIHKKLSFIYFKIGDIQTALLFGNHSLSMFQQFYGFQHVQTIDNLAMMGTYHCAQRNFPQAQHCMFRALYYAYLSFSEAYPEILVLWMNLSTIYEIQKLYTEAIMTLYEGLRVCIKVFTQQHLNTAVYYAALSYLHFEIPDIMNAIKFKEKSLHILQKLLPATDTRIKQSIQILDYMKSLQTSKKIKEVHEKELRKLQHSAFGYHLPQVGAWEFSGRNGRGNPTGNLMAFGNRNLGRMHDYLLRESEEYWRRTAYGRKIR